MLLYVPWHRVLGSGTDKPAPSPETLLTELQSHLRHAPSANAGAVPLDGDQQSSDRRQPPPSTETSDYTWSPDHMQIGVRWQPFPGRPANNVYDADRPLIKEQSSYAQFRVSWAAAEPTEAHTDYEANQSSYLHTVEVAVDACRERGVKTELVLFHCPAWASVNGESGGRKAKTDTFAGFASRIARRFKGRVHSYQLAHEINLKPHMEDGDIEYVMEELFIKGAKAVRAVYAAPPAKKVIVSTAGCSPCENCEALAGSAFSVSSHRNNPSRGTDASSSAFPCASADGLLSFLATNGEKTKRSTKIGIVVLVLLPTAVWITRSAYRPGSIPEIVEIDLSDQHARSRKPAENRFNRLYDDLVYEHPGDGVYSGHQDGEWGEDSVHGGLETDSMVTNSASQPNRLCDKPTKRQENHYRKMKKALGSWVSDGETGIGQPANCRDFIQSGREPCIELVTKGLRCLLSRDGVLKRISFRPEGMEAQDPVTNVVDLVRDIHSPNQEDGVRYTTNITSASCFTYFEVYQLVEVAAEHTNFTVRCFDTDLSGALVSNKVQLASSSRVRRRAKAPEWPRNLPVDVHDPSWDPVLRKCFDEEEGYFSPSYMLDKFHDRTIYYHDAERAGPSGLIVDVSFSVIADGKVADGGTEWFSVDRAAKLAE